MTKRSNHMPMLTRIEMGSRSAGLIRTRVNEIREMGRSTQGVTLINLGEGEKLAGLERIEERDVAGNGNGNGHGPEGGNGGAGGDAGGDIEPDAPTPGPTVH